jgi:hypothetical protein
MRFTEPVEDCWTCSVHAPSGIGFGVMASLRKKGDLRGRERIKVDSIQL